MGVLINANHCLFCYRQGLKIGLSLTIALGFSIVVAVGLVGAFVPLVK